MNEDQTHDTEHEICHLYEYEKLQDMEFYTHCFNESIRMQPPVYVSSTACVSEDVNTKAGLRLKKGDMFCIAMHHLCKNPQEW